MPCEEAMNAVARTKTKIWTRFLKGSPSQFDEEYVVDVFLVLLARGRGLGLCAGLVIAMILAIALLPLLTEEAYAAKDGVVTCSPYSAM